MNKGGGMHRIVICTTCEGKDGVSFANRLRRALADSAMEYDVRTHECMSSCAHPLAVAFAAPDKATYLFRDIDPDMDLTDTLAFARLYAQSPDGWIDDARPAGRLRHCLAGRIPA